MGEDKRKEERLLEAFLQLRRSYTLEDLVLLFTEKKARAFENFRMTYVSVLTVA
jgi:hypothetical protein